VTDEPLQTGRVDKAKLFSKKKRNDRLDRLLGLDGVWDCEPTRAEQGGVT